MFKELGNMGALLKQAREIQGRMGEVQDQLARLKVEGAAGGGMVRVEANGQQKILSVTVDESLVRDGDREMMEDLIVAACNQALDKAREAASEQFSSLTGNLQLPGLDEALSNLGLGGKE